MQKRNKRLIKNTSILAFGQMCTRGVMFFMTPLFTHWLSQSEYGIFDLIVTYVMLLIPIITLESGQSTFRFLFEPEENEEKSIITNGVLIIIVGSIIGFLFVLITFIIYEHLRYILFYFYLLLLSQIINSFMAMVLRGLKKLPIYTMANIIFVISMSISVMIFVKIFDLGLKGIVLGYSCGYIISSIFMIIKSRIYKLICIDNINFKLIKNMIKYSLPLIPSNLSWWIMNVSDRTIVSIRLGAAQNAIYSVANKIPSLCKTLYDVFHMAWLESAIETIKDKDIGKYYSDVLNYMLRILIPISCIILSFNFIFFTFLFENEYYLGYYQVSILMISIIFSVIAQFFGSIYIALMKSRKNGITTILSAGINLLVLLVLINYVGLYAASISTLISYLSLCLIRYLDIYKEIQIKFDKVSMLLLLIFIYFVITNFLNIKAINYVNILLSMLLFIIVNKKVLILFVKIIYYKMLNKELK